MDMEWTGKCACAGAPKMSSAVLRANACWKAGAPILTLARASAGLARRMCISQETFSDFFFDPAQPGGHFGSGPTF